MERLIPFADENEIDVFDDDYDHDYNREKLGDAMEAACEIIKDSHKREYTDCDIHIQEMVEALEFNEEDKPLAEEFFHEQIKFLWRNPDYQILNTRDNEDNWANPRQLF
eukprot:TRINITY_DN9218_c0_g1_i1.p2 TRINITY_DN9218_c0_g1~~TRINITY_DN9218_c0_g1_i1.p2  ORF type:complete len:109 (+),score=26.48 TRINITY_DN9218_c0_g1_i1:196-522(+)